jgi:hypothetical protein
MVGVSLILVATNTSPDVARAARHLPTPAIALQTNTSSGTVRSGAAFAPSRRRDKTRQSEFRTATIIGLRVYLLSAERLTFSGLGRGNLPRGLTQPTSLRGGRCRASMGPMDNVPFAPLFVRDPRLAPYVTSIQPAWLWSAKDARVIAIASGANHSTLVTITFPTRLLPRAQPVTI